MKLTQSLMFAAAMALSASAFAGADPMACAFGDASFEAGCERSSAQASANMKSLADKADAAKSGEAFRCWWGSGSFEEGCPAAAPAPNARVSAAPAESDPMACAFGDGSFERGCERSDMAAAAEAAIKSKSRDDQIRWGWIDGSV